MRYPYYPGCAMEGTGRAFEESLVAVLGAFDVRLDELEDWNCCGASAADSIDEVRGVALAARNLALAEATAPNEGSVDLLTPCAGCYRALLLAKQALRDGRGLRPKVQRALEAVALPYPGRVRVRHVLDVLATEIGPDRIREAVVRPLSGLRVACYYGCLLVRPEATFDDQRDPTSMDRLLRAVGAEPIDWPMKTRCCGGSCYGADPFSGTTPQGALTLSHAILREAKRRGADAVATACPLCQFNLEAFQETMERRFGTPLDLTVGYLTQFVGLALGLEERALGIHRMLRWHLPPPRGSAPVTASGRKGGAHG
ncbi:MAG: heterodisulfide reductase subunit B [Actinomycetota bacterium]|nr:MAG: heterodisulfide reductase subunit B [Actinomycetota bacterium]